MLGWRGQRRLRAPVCIALLALAGCADEEGSEVKTHDPGPPPIEIVGGAAPERREGRAGGTAGEATATAPVAAKARYVSAADAVCRRFRPRIRRLERSAQEAADAGDYGAAAAALQRAVAESEAEVAALRELRPPPGSEAALERMYAGIERSNRLFRGAAAQLGSGDVAAYNSTADRARLAALGSRRIAASFGFGVCGRG